MTPVSLRELREIAIGAVGLLVLIAVLVLSYGRSAVDGDRPGDSVRLSAVFDQVDGLQVGDPVLISGVRVGRVAHLKLTEDYRARVAFDVENRTEIYADAAAAIHTDGLFGSKFVRLDPGGGAREQLGDGDVVAYTQKAFLVSEILDLIISAGRQARADAEAR